jgi:hypothetical protein
VGLGLSRRLAAGLLALVIAACNGAAPTSPGKGTGNGGSNGGGTGGGGGPNSAPNTPPVVKEIVPSATRVEVGSPVTLTATVEDAETPVASLTYAWTVPNGSVTGTGASVSWTPGSDAQTPADFTVTLTVTERYTSGGVQLQNTATGTVSVHVNNSSKELADLSLRFLGMFADSAVSPETCVAEFSDTCNGKKDEFADISDNRHDYQIVASQLKHTGLSIAADQQKATVHTACSFTSRIITTEPREEFCAGGKCPLGSIWNAEGDCWTTNVYQNGRWWICESHFTPKDGILTDFARAFFGIRREIQ